MKKSIFAALTAALVLSMSTITAFAASPTVGTTEAPVAGQTATTAVNDVASAEVYAATTTVSEGYTEKAVSQTTIQSATVAVQNLLLNNVAQAGTLVGDANVASAAQDSSKKVSATLISVVDVSASTAKKGADGYYEVTLASANIAANRHYAVLHYGANGWEVVPVTGLANGAISFKTASLSPIAVVDVAVTATATSPKTGEAVPFAAVMILVGIAGAAVCGKKVFA